MTTVPTKNNRWQLQLSNMCTRKHKFYLVIIILMIIMLVLIKNLPQVKTTFLHYYNENQLFILPESFTSVRGAYCLDGSPPGYYYRPSSDLSVNSWIIYLPGGAWCTSKQDCYNRSLTAYGSSHLVSASFSYEGFLSNDCNQNPDFCMWNVIVLVYCDGGSFLGNVSGHLKYNTHTLYLRGGIIFDTLLEYLITATRLGHAGQVLLAGSSAGGMAALTHADRLYNLLPKSVKKVQVVVDGAMFVDVPSVSGYNIIAETFQSVYKVHNLKSSLSAQRCIQNQTPETEWRCLLPEVFSSYVITPAFFINSVYDTWQCAHSLKVPCFSTCLDCNTDALYTMRDAIRHLASQIVKSRKNKVFLTWCPLHIIITKPWIFELIGHPTLQISLACWLQEDMTQNNVDIVLSLESAHKHCGTILNYS